MYGSNPAIRNISVGERRSAINLHSVQEFVFGIRSTCNGYWGLDASFLGKSLIWYDSHLLVLNRFLFAEGARRAHGALQSDEAQAHR